MTTNFPTSLDSLVNPLGTDPASFPSHAAQHANINDAIEALEIKVGVDGSADTNSLEYRVTYLETASNTIYTDEKAQDAVGSMVSGNTETGILVSYDDENAKLNFVVTDQFPSHSTTNLAEGTNLYFTSSRALIATSSAYDAAGAAATAQSAAESYTDSLINALTTSDIEEGSNLYFTDERAQDVVNTAIVAGRNITKTYDDVANTITLDVDVAVGEIDSITFDTTAGITPTTVGQASWDAANETLQILLNGDVTLQVGQEHVIRVKNASGSVAIPDRTAVMFAGATGDTVTVNPAISTSSYEPSYLVGITTEEIPADGFGFVTQFGFVNHVNTDGWNLGDLLYVDPATPGGLTSTQPSAPNWKFPIAAVTRKHAQSGRILVRAIPGAHLHDLSDLAIDSPADKELVSYHASNGTWINQTSDELGLATKTYADAAVSTHSSDTTDVHGISDTSLLATKSYADGAVSTHSSDTTNVHGISDTSLLATKSYADTAAANAAAAIVDSAPSTLNTLNELAAALGNDANYASTITTALGLKAPLASPTFTGTVSGITKSMVGLSNIDNTSDVNKPISTATQTALDAKVNVLITINQQSSSYTILSTDAGKLIEMSNGGTVTITDSSSFPVGFTVDVLQTGASQVSIAGNGFTPNGTPGLKLRAQWSSATLIKRGSNSWVVVGDLSA